MAVLMANNIKQMDVELVIVALTQTTGNIQAQQVDAGDAEHGAPTEEEYFDQWVEEMDKEGMDPRAAEEDHMGNGAEDHEGYAADAIDDNNALENSGTGSGNETANPAKQHWDAEDGEVDPAK